MNKLATVTMSLIIGIGILFSDNSSLSEPVTTLAVENIKCQIDSFTDSNGEISVPVNTYAGSQVMDDLEKVEYRGFTAYVIYNPGNEYDTQTSFNMIIEKEGRRIVYSTMYDYYPEAQVGPINVLHFDDMDEQLRLQCGIEM